MKKQGKLLILFSLLVAVFTGDAYAAGIKNLAEAVAVSTGISKAEANRQINNVIAGIKTELKEGNEVTIRNFGRFYVQARDARVGRNPKTGEKLNIPAKRYPKFSSSDAFKAELN